MTDSGRHGRIDICVNAAGIFPRRALLELPLDEWHSVFSANVDGTFLCSQHAAQLMTAQGSGVIINLASKVAYRVDGNSAHYRASKAAVIAITQNIAVELGPSGVRAIAVCPGLTLTEGVDRLQAGGFDRYSARLPLGRAAKPDDVARVVLFAASPLASFMTGNTLVVDGGGLHK